MPTIYLDENSDDDLLIANLRAAGFGVVNPRDAGTVGRSDPAHLDFAARNNYVLLTHDADYERWSTARIKQGKSHFGILIVYLDNDKGRDMLPAEIARAIQNLLKNCPPLILANTVHSLNSWRY